MTVLTYAPWEPREGLRRWFTELTDAWDNPNSHSHSWPQATLEAVCQRGTPIPFRYDIYATESPYFIRSQESG